MPYLKALKRLVRVGISVTSDDKPLFRSLVETAYINLWVVVRPPRYPILSLPFKTEMVFTRSIKRAR